MRKISLSIVAGALITTTLIFAQKPDKNGEPAEVIAYIRKETIGGKLDFSSVLKEPGFLPIDHNGVRFNRIDYPVFLWGKAVSDSGLESSAKAAELWEEIHRQKLTNPQRTALKIGFEKQHQ